MLPVRDRLKSSVTRAEPILAGLLVIVFGLHALIYSAGPIFEPPDERLHYAYIRYLVAERAFPDPYADPGQEYHQPPLYYLLAAPLAALVDALDADGYTAHEPQANTYHDPQRQIVGNDNRNLYIHPRAESFPYTEHDDARAIHVLRLLSIALAVGTVIAAYACFRLLWPDRTWRDSARRLLALGFVVFMPQFAYISSALNNDNLLTLLATLSLYLLLRQLRDGPSRRNAIVLGLVLGAALLTKLNAAFLAFPTALVVLRATWTDRRQVRYGALTLAVVIAVAGGWYARNWIKYDDLTGTRVYFDTWPNERIRPGALALDAAWDRLPRIYDTFWANFGHRAVNVSDTITRFYDVFAVIVVVGALVGLVLWPPFPSARMPTSGPHRSRPTAIAFWFGAVVLIFLLAWTAALIYSASLSWSVDQGRFLLPAIVGWGALVAFGIDGWLMFMVRTPQSIRVNGRSLALLYGGIAFAMILFLGGVAGACLFDHFLPAYRPAPVPSNVALDVAYDYEGVAELIGAAPGTARVRPGDQITLTLIWRAIQPAESGLLAYLHTADADIVQRNSLPATGNLLATDWEPGETWAEHYVVQIPNDAPEQTVFVLVAGLYDPARDHVLTATDPNGDPITPVVGRLAINDPPQEQPVVYRFGDVIGLDEPLVTRESDQVYVCMRWSSLRAVAVDYQIFAHLLDANGERIAQADTQPKGGAYPTGVWSPGEVIADCVTINAVGLPTEGWSVSLGLYNLNDFMRLPVSDAERQSLGDRVLVGE